MSWEPAKLQLRPARLVLSWVTAAAAIALAAAIVPGFALEQSGTAFAVAAAIAVLNAVVPPVLAALRLPFMLVAGFLLVLAANALLLQVASDVLAHDVQVGSFGDALLAALVIAAASVVLETLLGTNDDDAYNLRVTRRIARRQGANAPTDEPGIPPAEPIIGAAAVHMFLLGWRQTLSGGAVAEEKSRTKVDRAPVRLGQ